MKKILIILLSVIFILTSCKKTDIKIMGFITYDKGAAVLDKNVPMPNAKISIQQEAIFEVLTDQAGYFSFKDVQAGTWKITVEKDGYVVQHKTITVVVSPNGNTYQENFKLEKKKP